MSDQRGSSCCALLDLKLNNNNSNGNSSVLSYLVRSSAWCVARGDRRRPSLRHELTIKYHSVLFVGYTALPISLHRHTYVYRLVGSG